MGADGSCGQSDLNCDYIKYAKAAEKGLADGTCADQGYTVQTGTQTKSYPIIGDIVITTYSKGLSSSADIDCSTATCQEACTCSLDKCASEIATCMSAPNCASAQTCALACGCGDTACTLKCAAASPSIKALPAAKCINSNCNIPPALESSADIDCSKATCQEACTCSLDKCASEIATCMDAPNCASAQTCALAC